VTVTVLCSSLAVVLCLGVVLCVGGVLCALVGPPQASSVMDLVLDVRISQSWPATVQQC
jgi:hypothetical protein